MKLKLYHYWRSSCSWRVRWAFALKGIECEWVHIHLLKSETQTPEQLARNPMAHVPVLEFRDSPQGPRRFLTESTAIIEWCEEAWVGGSPNLLPADLFLRAKARQLAQIVNSGTQPLQNLSVAKKVSEDAAVQKEWNVYWVQRGIAAYEKALAGFESSKFSISDTPSYPDLFLIPQIYNAHRFEIDMKAFPKCQAIYEAALLTQTCQAAHPDRFEPK